MNAQRGEGALLTGCQKSDWRPNSGVPLRRPS
jgi:hypothetical protein